MNVDPKNPDDPKRDRLVLSKGHCAPALYSVLAEKGYFSMDELKNLRKPNMMLQGHPDMKATPGIDMSSGSLGQGVSAACGMALSAKISGEDYRVYAVLGDGEIQEGQVWEAAMFAGHNKLDNLCLIIDNNGLQIDGEVGEVCSPYPIAEKYRAFGFEVFECCGHCMTELSETFAKARAVKGKPCAVVLKTVKGKGVSFMENAVGWHGTAPNKEQYDIAMSDLDEIEKQLNKRCEECK